MLALIFYHSYYYDGHHHVTINFISSPPPPPPPSHPLPICQPWNRMMVGCPMCWPCQGSLCLGLVAKDGVLLVADRRSLSSKLLEWSQPKIGLIHHHMAYAMSGIIPDGRVLIRAARLLSQVGLATSPLSLYIYGRPF